MQNLDMGTSASRLRKSKTRAESPLPGKAGRFCKNLNRKTIGEMFMKKFVLFGLALFVLSCVQGFGASPGIIDCQGRSSVRALSRPNGMIEIKQLYCGESVSILGMEQSYVEIQVDKNLSGFVEARYVRMLNSSSDPTQPAVSDAVAKPSFTAESSSRDTRPALQNNSSQYNYGNKPDYPRFEIFAGYSFSHWGESDKDSDEYGRYEENTTLNMNGWNAAFTSNINSVFGIKGEVSGIYGDYRKEEHYYPQYGDASHDEKRYPQHGYSIMVGPQITGRLSLPFDIFGHALFGIEHMREQREETRANNSIYKYVYTENAFAMAVGGGIDWKIGSLVIRAPQVDYFPWSFGGSSYSGPYNDNESPWVKNLRISAGVVFRFGGK